MNRHRLARCRRISANKSTLYRRIYSPHLFDFRHRDGPCRGWRTTRLAWPKAVRAAERQHSSRAVSRRSPDFLSYAPRILVPWLTTTRSNPAALLCANTAINELSVALRSGALVCTANDPAVSAHMNVANKLAFGAPAINRFLHQSPALSIV
jgi:hypothetical protein